MESEPLRGIEGTFTGRLQRPPPPPTFVSIGKGVAARGQGTAIVGSGTGIPNLPPKLRVVVVVGGGGGQHVSLNVITAG